MTQEEKARAYDEALQTAKCTIGKNKDFNDELACLPIIFPELKESKDERIRKEILEYIKNTEGQSTSFIKYHLWIEWLEKQGEKCSFDATDEELVQAKKDAFNDALDKIEYSSGEPTFDDGWCAAIKFIRQKQWKPTKEQMDTFSELAESEDERMREQVVYAINQLHVCECTKNKLLVWFEKQDKQSLALYKIATILSQYEDKDGSPLEQIRAIMIDNCL